MGRKGEYTCCKPTSSQDTAKQQSAHASRQRVRTTSHCSTPYEPCVLQRINQPTTPDGAFSLFLTGQKGRKSAPRGDGDDDFDDAMSTTSFDTIDTYGSGIDVGDGGGDLNGGWGRSEGPNGGGSGGAGGSGGGERESKAADDFKEGVDMLTEKRCVSVE